LPVTESGHPRVGLISDTHGLLRDRVVEALRGVDHIVHAGDVGDPQILQRLGALAPVTAVRGNVDAGAWAWELPVSAEVEIGGQWLHVRHIVEELDLKPEAAGFAAVIHGHSHLPAIEEHNGVLYVNPGSAGPRRFKLPVSVAILDVGREGVSARVLSFEL
jgi:putative phosphoesterase